MPKKGKNVTGRFIIVKMAYTTVISAHLSRATCGEQRRTKSREAGIQVGFAETRLLAILLVVACLVVFAVHWPALSAQAMSFDDDQYLINNRLVQNPGWESARRFLTEVLKPSTVEGYYQPMAMISLMLDYAAGGRPDNLLPFHLTSVCLHVANTALIIVLLYMLFGRVWPAVLVGLLFGVHPLTVEPIPWIGERKTLLASFFALWCLVLYASYARKPNHQDGLRHWKLFTGVAAAYVLALMSKPTVTFLPVLLILLDFWPLRRLNYKTLKEKFPLLVIMVIFAFITVVSQKRAAGLIMPGEYGHTKIPLILCHNIIFYLSKIVWPVNLSSHYPFPNPLAPSNPAVLASLIGTCVLLPALVLSLRWTRAFLTGWLFFFIAIFPTMGVIGFTDVIASDKYAYFPSVGLLIVLTWLLGRLWPFARNYKAYRIIIVVFLLSLVAAESVAAHRQSLRWRTTETLYTYMLSLTPDVASLHYNYGFYLYNNGRLDESKRQFSDLLRLTPRNYRVHNVIGILYSFEGKTEAAIASWQRTLELKPDSPDALNNLAWIRATNEDPAIRNPEEALALAGRACSLTQYNQPDNLDTLAAAYAAVGQFPDAIKTAELALNLAQSAGKKDLAQNIQNHLALYRAGQSYIEKHPLPAAVPAK